MSSPWFDARRTRTARCVFRIVGRRCSSALCLPAAVLRTVERMCESVQCPVCGKTSWTGCGDHVRDVFRGVRRRDRCTGHGLPRHVFDTAGFR